MKKIIVLILFILSGINKSESQTPTLGLMQNEAGSFDGYTLFSPNTYSKSYLIDNCGNMVNSWQGSSQPGLSAYLLENGMLLRTARVNNAIFSATGGSGGRIEMYDWPNNLIWAYNYSDSTHHQHHDIEYLPNGNVLVLAWETKSANYVLDRGRSPSLVNSSLWLEHIVELAPMGLSGANIVWEWHVSDHLIQDIDSSKLNYGIVQNHPELINFNFANSANQDWLHINSIDYNPHLDQIILSVHNSGEIWIIDHSTSSAEAAGHTGGNSGKGGDLLYRWGNPRAYLRGASADQKLWGQHDAHWIEPGLNDAGKIMVFNNGIGRTGANYSSVDIIQTPLDSSRNYYLNGAAAYGPDTLDWQYSSTPASAFYSSNISGAQRLPNGNTLICEGSSGNFFEIDTNKLIVWNYINPVNQTGPLSQGSNPTGNAVFRCTRFGSNYTGFNGQNLTAGLPVELNPYPSNCTIYTSIAENDFENKFSSIEIYPNPVLNELFIKSFIGAKASIEIMDMQGRVYKKFDTSENEIRIPLQDIPAGIYIICIRDIKSVISKRIIKISPD